MTRTGDSPRPAILIAGEGIALSVARSLGRAGIPVYGLGHGTDPLGQSRYCREFIDVGSGDDLQRQTLEWLESDGPRGAVILPCDDEPLELIADNRRRLVELGYQPIETDDDVVRAMLDKGRTYEIADELGIERPMGRVVGTAAEVEVAAEEAGYPCALKPLSSHLWARHFPLTTKALIVGDRDELRRALGRIAGLDVQLMLTELIPGGDDQYWSYLSYLDDRGQALFDATKRKIRQYPPGYGQSTYNVLEWNPDAAALGKRFLQDAGVRGPAYVEFKLDPRDQRLKLIECNHRFVGPNELLLRGGVDLPLLTYNRLVGRPDPELGPVRWGVAVWSPLADTRAFLASRQRGELTLAGWLRTLLRRTYGPMLRWNDPGPSLARLSRRLRKKLGRET